MIALYLLHVLICIFLILVVLLQQGKGADLAVFGGGSTQAAFGARGAATLLHKLTVGAFVLFMLTTVGITLLQPGTGGDSVLAGEEAGTAVEETAAEDPAPAATTDDGAASDAEAPVAGDEAADEPEAEPAADEAAGDGQSGN